jgi:hypothetical protein
MSDPGDEVADCSGDEHLIGASQGHDSGGEVDADPSDV